MALIDKDKAVDAIAMYLFINDAIKSPVPMKVADYKTFAESILKDVPEVPKLVVTASRIVEEEDSQ